MLPRAGSMVAPALLSGSIRAISAMVEPPLIATMLTLPSKSLSSSAPLRPSSSQAVLSVSLSPGTMYTFFKPKACRICRCISSKLFKRRKHSNKSGIRAFPSGSIEIPIVVNRTSPLRRSTSTWERTTRSDSPDKPARVRRPTGSASEI